MQTWHNYEFPASCWSIQVSTQPSRTLSPTCDLWLVNSTRPSLQAVHNRKWQLSNHDKPRLKGRFWRDESMGSKPTTSATNRFVDDNCYTLYSQLIRPVKLSMEGDHALKHRATAIWLSRCLMVITLSLANSHLNMASATRCLRSREFIH